MSVESVRTITIAVCDDDREQVQNLRRLLSRWAGDKPFAVTVQEYGSAEEFLFHYPDKPCSLLLLDIEMRGQNGMELAKNLRKAGDMLPIIFVTGYSEYISEGYDVDALHYLLKPLDFEKLSGVLDKYVRRMGSKSDEILIAGSGGAAHVAADDIAYIEAFGRRTQVHLADGSIMDCNQGIGRFGEIRGFVQCHRSYLVNLRHVKGIERTLLALDTGGEIPLSRRLYQKVNQAFISYYT